MKEIYDKKISSLNNIPIKTKSKMEMETSAAVEKEITEIYAKGE